jgi:hypothetical protein
VITRQGTEGISPMGHQGKGKVNKAKHETLQTKMTTQYITKHTYVPPLLSHTNRTHIHPRSRQSPIKQPMSHGGIPRHQPLPICLHPRI